MKNKFSFRILAIILTAVVSSFAHAVEQWPGQDDFSNLNGPGVPNNAAGGNTAFLSIPLPARPVNNNPWFAPPVSQPTTQNPVEYNSCEEDQVLRPERNISCSGQ
jgi:hypothetical protein